MMSSFLRSYRALVILRPRLTLLLVMLLLLTAVMGLPRFKLDASADSLTLENDAALDYFREVSKRYQSGDFLVVTFTPHGELFSDDVLTMLAELRDQLATVDNVVSVNSILDVPLLYSPLVDLDGLKDPKTLLSEGVDRDLARQEFLTSPIYRDMLLGPDQQTTALLLNLAVDNRYIALVRERDELRARANRGQLSAKEAARLEVVSAEFLAYRTAEAARSSERVAAVRSIMSGYKDRADLFLGGVSMITTDMIAFIKSDLVVFGSAILVFIVLLMSLIFRRWQFVLWPLTVACGSVLLMLGMLSWLDWRLTVISSNFVALLLIIGLAITIHLVVRYRELAFEHRDWAQAELVTETVRFMFKPVLFTALTTMVAFASLVVSDIKPVMDFGWYISVLGRK